ncbi:MAG: hypothetical protein NTW28_14790 [Candidatus Solibacter sp.]|nr:hypothetical protein [Candidatus Solibacter sp.]
MRVNRENLPALCILLAVLAVNAWALRAELHSGGVDLNDNVSHFRLAAEMAGAMEHGEHGEPVGNPLDFWSPEWSLGFPLIRVYQPLAHLLPLTFFAMSRHFELPPLTAAAAACLAPLISTPQLYGLEYESYVWAGFGLFPQAVATHFLLLTLGLAYRALRRGGSATLAGIMLGLAFLCQFIYGYMGALSVCLLALVPGAAIPRPERLRRVLWIGAVALVLSAFQLAPLWIDRAFINRTPRDQLWKADSFGAGQALEWLITGQLLDSGRFPVLSLLALAGLIVLWLRFYTPRGMEFAGKFALSGAAFWILVFFGRPFWGPALWLIGVTPDLHLHRVLGGAQVFLVVLAAIGLAAIWGELSRRLHLAAAIAATLALFYPMVRERGQFLDMNATRLQRTVQAMQQDRQSLDTLTAATIGRGGRAFAGLATPASWGPSFKIGAVPMYHALAAARVPTVGYLSHTMALTSGVMLGFDERNPAHYRLFDVSTFIVPAGTRYPVPVFLTPGTIFGRFQIFDTPANGYFDLVDVPAALPVDRDSFFDTNLRWLKTVGPSSRQHLRLDLPGGVPGALSPPDANAPSPGDILNARQSGEVYQAEFLAARPAWVLFKMTWHPNWKAWLDGQPRGTAMLTPGFVGVAVPAGRHTLLFRYQPGNGKLWMALAGLLAVLLMAIAERRWHQLLTSPAPSATAVPSRSGKPPADARGSNRSRDR